MTRIAATFARLAEQNRSAFVAYLMAGDPDRATSTEIAARLPAAGVDVIELGFPFTDPMADGPTIQRAGQRALAGGQTLAATLEMAREVRETAPDTPIVLMGYYNPIHNRGVEAFLAEAVAAGVDGLIVVDLPPEEDAELCGPAKAAGLDFIRLTAPTTDAARLPRVVAEASGFVYYISVTGTTGAAAADAEAVAPAVARIRAESGLPVAVGFGVKTPEVARAVGRVADGVVVGSAIVERIERGDSPDAILRFVADLAAAAHGD